MPSSFAVFIISAILTAAAAFWVLRAYRRGTAPRAAPALLVSGATIALALGFYLGAGRPDLPDAPYAARLEALKHRDPTSLTAEEALAILGEAARDHPGDPLPLIFTGQVLLETGRDEEAARAFDAALRRDPAQTEAMLGLGRAMVRIDEGRVSPEARTLFERVAAASDDPAPWIYQAMAAMQEERAADARRLWSEALARMEANDPRRAMAQRMSAGESE